MFINKINSLNVSKFRANEKRDKVEINPPQKELKISNSRLIVKDLTDEEIATINKTKMLPENAKFVASLQGKYAITPNLVRLKDGTRELPEGFEVRKDILGFAVALPIGSEGFGIRKKAKTEE